MDTEQFLTRVIPPGNYIAIAFNPHPERAGNGFVHQFFPGGNYSQAARVLRWAAGKGWDAYHALASFTMAEAAGVDARNNQKYKGSRTQENAQRLKVLWIDLDVKRAGDKKKAENVYATQAEAMQWLKGFLAATGLPRPNLAVYSGYGIHVYWVLEDPLSVADWLPYSSALKAAMLANGYRGDSGLSSDAARILRPPGTVNMKSGTPAPVTTIDKMSTGDYPNALVLSALQPYVGQMVARTTVAGLGTGATVSTLSGGGASPMFAAQAQPNLNAAAQANLPDRRQFEFGRIATKCAQVGQSLANHGNGDDRPLWYLGHLTLAHFCVDGADYAHEIGKGDPRYTQAGTDQAVQQIAAEQAKKGIGAPTCRHYETRGHKGVCQVCPHHGKIVSPLVLGADNGDLPQHYRRSNGSIQRWVAGKEEGGFWVKLLTGDVYAPVLDLNPVGGYSLMFTYEFAGRRFSIKADDPTMPSDGGALRSYFAAQNLSLNRGLAPFFGDFIVAWIEHLRENRAEREDRLLPFGWAKDSLGAHAGFAVGGTLYRPDGAEESVPGGDSEIVAAFRPRGTLAHWKTACDFVSAGGPDLQVIIATGFGAPLMKLTGHAGVTVSAWSRDSGVGKSAALRVNQAIWSAKSMMSSMKDTTNSIRKKIGEGRVMPANWDEVRTGKEEAEATVNLFFELTQGQDKGRLNADTSLRHAGEWETILTATSNSPLMDHVVQKGGATDAGALRLFEFHVDRPPLPQDPQAANTIALVNDNYGSAGREYARWLGANFDEVNALVQATSTALVAALGAVQAERFYVAGMTCILVGAKVANKIGLASFDLRGMYAYLKRAFTSLRDARVRDLIVHNGTMDIEQVLGSFMADNSGHKLITDQFARRGPNAGTVAIVWFPPHSDRVDIHISQADKVMRINRQAFVTWCYRFRLPVSEVIDGFGRRWGATVVRRVIGAGTGYAGGQLNVIDIPLLATELESYLYEAVKPISVHPATAKALAGNQPQVK